MDIKVETVEDSFDQLKELRQSGVKIPSALEDNNEELKEIERVNWGYQEEPKDIDEQQSLKSSYDGSSSDDTVKSDLNDDVEEQLKDVIDNEVRAQKKQEADIKEQIEKERYKKQLMFHIN